MSTASPQRLMTIEEFHALPPVEGVVRDLVRGVVWERPMTRRNRWHSQVESQIVHILKTWRESQPEPRGQVFSGEIGCDLPIVNSSVGIDVAYFSAEMLAAQPDGAKYLVGTPDLAVEILSPSDTVERVHEKIQDYLEAGTPHVWTVDVDFRTITVYQPDESPRMYSANDELTAEPHLPGFSVRLTNVFEA